MHRIIIADDEDYVRELLAKSINQSPAPFEVVGTAGDGPKALQLVQALKPDILISDICMPLMNGLELIQSVNRVDQNIMTVVISGYDDFEYAQKALGLGVSGYLLKPFSSQELFELLDKIKAGIESREQLRSTMQTMQERFDSNLHYLQERMLTELLQNPVIPPDFVHSAGSIQLDLEGSCFAVGMIHIKKAASAQGEMPAMAEVVGSLKKQFPSGGGEVFSAYLLGLQKDKLAALFVGRGLDDARLDGMAFSALGKIGLHLQARLGLDAWCVLGGCTARREMISQSYRQAMSVWQSTVEHTHAVVRWRQPAAQAVPAALPALPKMEEDRLMILIQMGRKEQALHLLDGILREYAASAKAGQAELVRVSLIELMLAISALMEKTSELCQEDAEVIVGYMKKIVSNGGLMDARDELRKYVTKCCEVVSGSGKSQSERIALSVKELIEQNLSNEDFSLETAASILFFSPNYVRQIFKQTIGESFVEYRIRRRMETAREMIQNPDNKIQSVALQTGYSNQRYFANSFKKYFGCTPSEYRHALQQKSRETSGGL